MKRFLLLTLLLLTSASAVLAQSSQTLGSTASAPRADSSSNYVDYWTVKAAPVTLFSCFGYNSGAQQWLQFFDSANGPTVAVTSWNATTDKFTATNHGLSVGQRIQLTNTTAGISAGIYYVGLDTNSAALVTNSVAFYLYDTLANAQAASAGGRQDVTGATSTATFRLLPVHIFAIATVDNYSCVVPVTGFSFGKGFTVANSTTGATYSPGAKDVTIFVTFRTGL